MISQAALTLPAATVEYLKAPVVADVDGAPADPTGDQVELCLLPAGTAPDTGDWVVGSWETATTPAGPEHLARLLYPGDLTPGYYTLWLRLTRPPETVVRAVGRVRLT